MRVSSGASIGRRSSERALADTQTVVQQVHPQHDGRPIQEFVPVLVEREVTETLHLTLHS